MYSTAQRLSRYIRGANVDEVKLEMAAPVVSLFRPTHGFRESDKNYKVAFFIPNYSQVSHLLQDSGPDQAMRMERHVRGYKVFGRVPKSGYTEMLSQQMGDTHMCAVPLIALDTRVPDACWAPSLVSCPSLKPATSYHIASLQSPYEELTGGKPFFCGIFCSP